MASEIKVDTIVNAGGDNDSGIDLSTNDKVAIKIADSEVATVDTTGIVLNDGSADRDFRVESNGNTHAIFVNGGDERVSIFQSGTLDASGDNTDDGLTVYNDGRLDMSRASGQPINIRRRTDEGIVIAFYKEASGSTTNIGNIGVGNNALFIVKPSIGGINFASSGSQARPVPCDETGAFEDDIHDFGDPSVRWDNIYASNGTIQTSDQNEKQDIANATAKELNVAKKLSALFKTFRWKSKVAKKDDKARTHSGIVAQDIQSAFSAEGLDASNYGLFCLDTWWEKDKKIYMTKEEAPEDATERTRLGVRYPELFSFIFSSIEARLTALESE